MTRFRLFRVILLAFLPTALGATELQFGELVVSATLAESVSYSAELAISMGSIAVEQSSETYSISTTLEADDEQSSDVSSWMLY